MPLPKKVALAMPTTTKRRRRSTPQIREHKATGRAYVYIAGKQTYLGTFGSDEAQESYHRLIAEWLKSGQSAPPAKPKTAERPGATIYELAAAYFRFAKGYYVKNGRRTDEVYAIKSMVEKLTEVYGSLPIKEFTPKKLDAFRTHVIDVWARKNLNKQVGRVVRMFAWGVAEELVDAGTVAALRELPPLKKGRTKARETTEVKPVSDDDIESAIAELSPIVADMVRIHRLLGCRPSELCGIRPCDIDRRGDVWVYIPEEHKNEHQGKERPIFIGPRAQSVLMKYLLRPEDSYCFSPQEAPKARCNALHKYTKDSYGRAVRRACKRAGVMWSPNQLRHAVGTNVREQFGLEAAQVVLGHSSADITQVYAERNAKLAREVAAKIG